MILRLLGTGAADGIPAFYGDCRVCRYARDHGGKDVRSRSAALIDDGFKIDLPPDTLLQMQRDRLTAKSWTALVFTHSDEDHFAVDQLQYALHPFTDMDHLGFTIYANETVAHAIWDRYPDWPMDVVVTRSFSPFQHETYRVTPIKATHGNGHEDTHNFVIEGDGRVLIYATDTGVWPEQTWTHLKNVKANLLVIECTDGLNKNGYEGHLDVEEVLHVVERLREQGTLPKESRVITTHHSHRGNAIHTELEAVLRPHGIEPGYDGLFVKV